MSNKSIFYLTTSSNRADKIIEQLKAANFDERQIESLFTDKGIIPGLAHEESTKAPKEAVANAGTAGVISTKRKIAGIGALARRAVRNITELGPIMASLSSAGAAIGAAVGAAVGPIIAVLSGSSVGPVINCIISSAAIGASVGASVGPIIAVLSGSSVGSSAGGLICLGLAEIEAKLKAGNILIQGNQGQRLLLKPDQPLPPESPVIIITITIPADTTT